MQNMGISLIEVGSIYLAEISQNRETDTSNSWGKSHWDVYITSY